MSAGEAKPTGQQPPSATHWSSTSVWFVAGSRATVLAYRSTCKGGNPELKSKNSPESVVRAMTAAEVLPATASATNNLKARIVGA